MSAYVCIVKSNGGLHLLIDDEDNVMGSPDKNDMLNYWTKGWEAGLERGGTWATSANISFISFSPSIFAIEDVGEIEREILGPMPWTKFRVWGEAGGFMGIECKGPNAEKYWEEGERPKLFSDEFAERHRMKQ